LGQVVGVPWTGKAGPDGLQAIFDAKCVECHNGQAGDANPSYTISDPATGTSCSVTFDLRGDTNFNNCAFGDEVIAGYSVSHLSLLGPDPQDLEDAGLEISGDFKIYVEPESARDSLLIQRINPPKFYTVGTEGFNVDMATRAFGAYDAGDVHQNRLTAEEYHMLILMADMGGQYYSRENAPAGAY
jgi:hypothetical protein